MSIGVYLDKSVWADMLEVLHDYESQGNKVHAIVKANIERGLRKKGGAVDIALGQPDCEFLVEVLDEYIRKNSRDPADGDRLARIMSAHAVITDMIRMEEEDEDDEEEEDLDDA